MKTPYDKLAKIYRKYFGHLTKMAAMAIHGKNLLKNYYLKGGGGGGGLFLIR